MNQSITHHNYIHIFFLYTALRFFCPRTVGSHRPVRIKWYPLTKYRPWALYIFNQLSFQEQHSKDCRMQFWAVHPVCMCWIVQNQLFWCFLLYPEGDFPVSDLGAIFRVGGDTRCQREFIGWIYNSPILKFFCSRLCTQTARHRWHTPLWGIVAWAFLLSY